MNYHISFSLFALGLNSIVLNVNAQKSTELTGEVSPSSYSSAVHEILVSNRSGGTIYVSVRNMENNSLEVNNESISAWGVWTANTHAHQAPSSADADLDEKTLYKITIDEGEEENEYLYYFCENGDAPYNERFYCGRDNNNPTMGDMSFVYENGTVEVYLGLNETGSGPSVDSKFSGSQNWILPYDLDTYCGSDSGCISNYISGSSQHGLSFFITP